MKIINNFPIKNFPIKNIILFLLALLFLSGLALIVSGLKIPSENRATKIISMLLGILLIVLTFFSAIYVIMFGYNS